MATYWVRAGADQTAQGPYSGSDLRKYATDGLITPEWQISSDGKKWVSARSAKGLFPAPAPAAHILPPTAPPPVVSSPPQQEIPEEIPLADEPAVFSRPAAAQFPAPGQTPQPIAYQSQRVASDSVAQVQLPNQKLLTALGIVSLLAPISHGIAMYGMLSLRSDAASQATVDRVMGTDLPMYLFGTLATFLLFIPSLILWLLWVFQANRAVREISGREYSISPGMAVGFSFIPVFAGFWIVYMPARLASKLNLMAGRPVVLVGLVIAMQVLSVVLAFAFAGLTPLCYVVSAFAIQKGMKQIFGDRAVPSSRQIAAF